MQVGIGAEVAAGPGGGYAASGGQVVQQHFELAWSPATQGFGAFKLANMSDASVQTTASTFAAIYNMFMGIYYGNHQLPRRRGEG